MNTIPLTAEETAATIARDIIQTILSTKSRIAGLRKDQPKQPAKEIKNSAGVVVMTVPARPDVSAEMIEAKLGKDNVELLDKLDALVAG